jgi:hypothetical protein
VDDHVLEKIPLGFFTSSVFRRMFRARWLQLPHLVFIRWRNSPATSTPTSGSHFLDRVRVARRAGEICAIHA